MTTLNSEKTAVDTSRDSIVICKVLETTIGGRSLDVTGFAPAVIKAGHVVIKEAATGVRKPMPVTGSAYGDLPTGHTFEGVVMASTMTNRAMVGILVRGTVNEVASPYPVTAAMKTALPLIRFTQD